MRTTTFRSAGWLAVAGLGVVVTEKYFVRKMGFEFFADLHVVVVGRRRRLAD